MKNEILSKVPYFDKLPVLGQFSPINQELYARQTHLDRYAGSVALVGSLPSTMDDLAQKRADRAVDLLEGKEIIEDCKHIGIRVIVPPTAIRSCENQQKSAELLNETITERMPGAKTFLRTDPVAIKEGPGRLADRAHQALSSAIKDFERDVVEEEEGFGYGSMGFVAIIASSYGTRAFGLRGYNSLNNNPVVALNNVGEKTSENRWHAVSIPPKPDSYLKPHLPVPQSTLEESAEAEDALEEVRRSSGRFTRELSEDRSPDMHPA